ncbi:MAG: hypothetical protein DHS20C15_10480 [Planctomycetota bacterium]|nr:MAG: hypothetical protein DHS20C15_10480 [Planctomycetota bacterium]
MSLFERDAVLSDERPNEMVAEGVTIERRSLLRLSVATLAAAFAATACATPARRHAAAISASSGPAPVPAESLEIAELIAEMSPRAHELVHTGGKNEEAYLMAVGALLARLQLPSDEQLGRAMHEFYTNGQADPDTREIAIVAFNLEPGGGFDHHDHRDYNGVILGVEGEARIKNYDILGDELVPPPGQTFQIRQTRDDLILPGRFSSLGRTRENVHNLVAGPEGARVLDVFTFYEADAGSYFMDVDPQARDPERGIFDATWR